MKKMITIALCALFAIHAAEARTLYVNIKRPNNKGNGLSAKTAKKTIQAAINIAKKGDTILVYPGNYAPIKTKNKKITIKSVKGKSKTTIKNATGGSVAIALLGKAWETGGYVDTFGQKIPKGVSVHSEGTSTTLTGFVIDGASKGVSGIQYGVSGGTVKSSTIKGIGAKGGGGVFGGAAFQANLTSCLITSNRYIGSASGVVNYCTLKQCSIKGNAGDYGNWSTIASSCTLINTLVARNSFDDVGFDSCTLLNCTVADNTAVYSYSALGLANISKFYNCILYNNTMAKGEWHSNADSSSGEWIDGWGTMRDGYYTCGTAEVHNVDKGCTYKNTNTTNKNPKLTSDYKLRKGSYAINKGKLSAAQKKLVGTKDLDGKKRIKGKAIDCGCYEY